MSYWAQTERKAKCTAMLDEIIGFSQLVALQYLIASLLQYHQLGKYTICVMLDIDPGASLDELLVFTISFFLQLSLSLVSGAALVLT